MYSTARSRRVFTMHIIRYHRGWRISQRFLLLKHPMNFVISATSLDPSSDEKDIRTKGQKNNLILSSTTLHLILPKESNYFSVTVCLSCAHSVRSRRTQDSQNFGPLNIISHI